MPAAIIIQEPCHWLEIAGVQHTLATTLIIPDMAHEEIGSVKHKLLKDHLIIPLQQSHF